MNDLKFLIVLLSLKSSKFDKCRDDAALFTAGRSRQRCLVGVDFRNSQARTNLLFSAKVYSFLAIMHTEFFSGGNKLK